MLKQNSLKTFDTSIFNEARRFANDYIEEYGAAHAEKDLNENGCWRFLSSDIKRGIRKKASKEKGKYHTEEEWAKLLKRYDYSCAICGISESLAKGGSDSIENIQPLCIDCNFAKGL